jgi:hypothetical protein
MRELAYDDGGELPQIREGLVRFYQMMEGEFRDLLPHAGPRSAKHFFVTLSATVINYCAYSALLRESWGADPHSQEMLRERRAHVHWLADTIVERLLTEADMGRKAPVGVQAIAPRGLGEQLGGQRDTQGHGP